MAKLLTFVYRVDGVFKKPEEMSREELVRHLNLASNELHQTRENQNRFILIRDEMRQLKEQYKYG
jgi:hypothetical protein